MLKNNNDCDEDDVITLHGCGKETKWRFPKNVEHCPVKKCHYTHISRSNLIKHFKATHAKHSILCDICYKPIGCYDSFNFRTHFRAMHPNMNVSYGLGNGMAKKTSPRSTMKKELKLAGSMKVQCIYCSKIITSENLNRHLSEIHTSKKLFCPWKNCTFQAKRVENLRKLEEKSHQPPISRNS